MAKPPAPRNTTWADVVDIMYGRNKRTDYSLGDIDDVRTACRGKEWKNKELLLRARIAELEWVIDDHDCYIHSLKQHLEELEAKIATNPNCPICGGKNEH